MRHGGKRRQLCESMGNNMSNELTDGERDLRSVYLQYFVLVNTHDRVKKIVEGERTRLRSIRASSQRRATRQDSSE